MEFAVLVAASDSELDLIILGVKKEF